MSMRLKNLIRDYSKQKKIPYKVAFLVIMGTWKEVYDRTGEMDKLNLRVPGLGDFQLKTWKAETMEQKVRLEMEEDPVVDRTSDIEKLQKVQQMHQEEQQRQYEHREKKRAYKLNKTYNDTKGDIPGSVEK